MTDVQIPTTRFDFALPMHLWPRAHREAIADDLYRWAVSQHLSATIPDARGNAGYALLFEDTASTMWRQEEFHQLSAFRRAVREGGWTITATVPQGDSTPTIRYATPASIRDGYSGMTAGDIAPWAPLLRRYARESDHGDLTQGGTPRDDDSQPATHNTLGNLLLEPRRYPTTLGVWFPAWLEEQGITSPATDRSPNVVIPTDPTIGPETPGWDEWWAELWEHATEDGYQEQYNTLARSLGGPEQTDEDDEERDFQVEVYVSGFTVYIPITETRRNMRDGEYSIDQADVDEAIREYTRNENVDYDTNGWEED